MDEVLASLTPEVREAVKRLAAAHGISVREAVALVIASGVSLAEVRDEGWTILAERNGDVRELAEA